MAGVFVSPIAFQTAGVCGTFPCNNFLDPLSIVGGMMPAKEQPAQHAPPRQALDLSSAVKKLRSSGYSNLARLVQDVVSARTVAIDLEEARTAIMLLTTGFAGPNGPQQLDEALLGRALFWHAIILYVRATTGSSDARNYVHVISAYSGGQNTAHKSIKELRDKALAHFGFGGARLKEPWAEHRLIHVVEADGRVALDVNGRAKNWSQHIAHDLLDLLDTSDPVG